MKTLEELNELLTDLPCPFAAEETDMDFPTSASSGNPATNYETGVPQKYSPLDKDVSLMPLKDFNRLGNLATRELFFRRCGGIHTFDEAFSGENLGYAKGALLHYINSDAKIFKPVESQESDNDLNFVADPAVIDAEVRKPSDSESATPRVLWKSVGHVYGLAEGLAHFGVDFSRRQDIPSGAVVAEDSLVLIGSNAWKNGIWDTQSGINYAKVLAAIAGANIPFEDLIAKSSCGSFKVEVNIGGISMSFPCKGLQGGAFSCSSVVLQQFWMLFETAKIYYSRFCGGASFPLAFFARKGTVISYKAYGNGNQIDDAVAAIAYPLETSVASENEEGGAV